MYYVLFPFDGVAATQNPCVQNGHQKRCGFRYEQDDIDIVASAVGDEERGCSKWSDECTRKQTGEYPAELSLDIDDLGRVTVRDFELRVGIGNGCRTRRQNPESIHQHVGSMTDVEVAAGPIGRESWMRPRRFADVEIVAGAVQNLSVIGQGLIEIVSVEPVHGVVPTADAVAGLLERVQLPGHRQPRHSNRNGDDDQSVDPTIFRLIFPWRAVHGATFRETEIHHFRASSPGGYCSLSRVALGLARNCGRRWAMPGRQARG